MASDEPPQWWCRLCPESFTTSAAINQHYADNHMQDLSTSAKLRQTQEDLAASQRDLTRSERARADLAEQLDKANAAAVRLLARVQELVEERDEARSERDEMVARKMRMQRDLDAQLAEARERLAEMTVAARKADLARAELASAQAELKQLRAELADVAPHRLEHLQDGDEW